MSAQDTTPSHKSSGLDFMMSITSKPLNELTFGKAVFSPVKVSVSFNSTDASHPCKMPARMMKRNIKISMAYTNLSEV
ncbi:hypothetical protein CR513_59174, partial [Mucuna pruriens]